MTRPAGWGVGVDGGAAGSVRERPGPAGFAGSGGGRGVGRRWSTRAAVVVVSGVCCQVFCIPLALSTSGHRLMWVFPSSGTRRTGRFEALGARPPPAAAPEPAKRACSDRLPAVAGPPPARWIEESDGTHTVARHLSSFSRRYFLSAGREPPITVLVAPQWGARPPELA